MVADLLWGIAFIVLVICIMIQRRALNRIAFGRSMFISGMSFLVSFIVVLAPPNPAVWVLFVFFQLLGWVFLIFMTIRSLRRMRESVSRHTSN